MKKIDHRKNNKGIPGKAGAKRKPDHERKINVAIYVKQGDVDTLGGKEKVREIMASSIVTELSIQ